jgi:hypothetical protein
MNTIQGRGGRNEALDSFRDRIFITRGDEPYTPLLFLRDIHCLSSEVNPA